MCEEVNNRTIVIGLGNTLLSDDGVGIYAVRQVRALLEPGEPIETEEAGIAGFALLDLLAGYDRAVVIDAVNLPDRQPGEIVTCSIDDFAPTSHLCALHQIDLPTALQLGRRMGQRMPEQVTIIGVQLADDRTVAEQCTPAVSQAIEPAARLALAAAREPRSR
jgi:hydrogenase maturation protease